MNQNDNIPLLLSIQNLTFGWKHTTLLENISCNLHEGQITQLKGENGAGKSTLLLLIAGMFPHFNRGEIFKGDIWIDGNSIVRQPPKKIYPTVAIIPGTLLDFFLFGETLAQEILITSALTKLSGTEVHQRMEQFAAFFPIINDLHTLPFKLMSFDQKALALTLIFYLQKPRLFLFDEVINPSSSCTLQQWMAFLNHLGSQPCAVIFINHQHPIHNFSCWLLNNKTLIMT